MDRDTGKKIYKTKTMDIYSFMARMLFFLPDQHRKMIRYYGIYAHSVGEKLDKIDKCTWTKAIEHSFNKDPLLCPDCDNIMRLSIVYSGFADYEMKKLCETHYLRGGYFRPKNWTP